MFTRTYRQWLRGIVESVSRKTLRGRKRPRPSSIRPQVEVLEDRTLPSGTPAIGDVFFIDMENHNLTQPAGLTGVPQQLLGNPAALFLNSLMTPGNPNAAQTSYASNYYNADYNLPSVSIHPSEPNYVWQEAGLTGPLNDADPYANTPNNLVNAPNLSALLQAAGIPWKSYQEDIDLLANSGSVNQPGANSLTSTVAPQSQWTVPTSSFSGTSSAYTNAYNGSHQYNFAVKHDGSLFFTATNGGTSTAPNFSPSNPEAPFYAPLQQLQTDLNNNTVARYNIITPDQFNDMHSSLNTNFTYNGVAYAAGTDQEAVALGDNFLSQIIPMIEASQAYQNNGVIVIWFDETEAGNSTSFTIPEIVISPLAKGNAYDSTLPYTHSSDLKSMQELFGVSEPGGRFLGDASTPGTNDLSDMFVPGALTPPVQAVEGLPVTAPVASLTTPLVPGNLLVSESVYQGTAKTVSVGQILPPGQTVPPGVHAIANGIYPTVFNNNTVDGSFGVTSPIFLDQITTSGTLVGSPINVTAEAAAAGINLATSFSSKSELALNLSTDGTAVTFMGYNSPINQLDVSNSNTPAVIDPTNPVPGVFQRAVGQIDANGNLQVTPVNAYSGNNGRAAILDSANGNYFLAGNAGNGGKTGPVSDLSNNTGVQMIAAGSTDPNTTVVGQVNGTFGSSTGYQRGFAVQQINPATGLPYGPADKTGKDDNFRGETIFNNTLFVTKGSGGNGIDTVYQVGTAGSLPTLADAGTQPISILPGFPTTLASSSSAHFFPFGIWFANATTLYVADEGDGTLADAATDPNAGLEKWSLDQTTGLWHLDYTLQAGLNLGVQYTVPGYPTGTNPVTGLPWSPETDGLRNITGKVNGDGTVTIYAITSTVSGSGDQGADPNKLVAITDTLNATGPGSEQFTTLKSAGFGEVLRGVSFTPSPTLAGTAATINWGDGTPATTGIVSLSGNTYTVTGTHTYNKEGTYPITTSFTQQGFNTTVFTTTLHNTAVVQDNIGILLLDQTGKGALSASGNASVSVTGSHGAIVVDSSSSQAAVASGNAQVSAGDIDATGTKTSGHAAFVGSIDTNEAPLADPLADLSAPPVPTTVRSTSTLNVTSDTTLLPGLYIGGITISGHANVVLEPGIYYLQGGGFTVSGHATVTDNGQGVLIYNAPGTSSDGITLSGQASVSLSGLTVKQVADLGLSAGFQGLAIFQDRNSTAAIILSGQGSLNVTGTVYAAAATVNVSANGSLSLQGSADKKFASHLLVGDLTVSANGSVAVDTSDNNLELL